jgi:hypothetical protein
MAERGLQMSDVKIYPSGFIGSAKVRQTKTKGFEDIARRIIDRAVSSDSSNYTASLDVIELWDVVRQNKPEFRTFEFKEKIIVTALNTFGASTLGQWIDLQLSSEEHSSHHTAWLEETMGYVILGARRKLNYDSWTMLLSADGKPERTTNRGWKLDQLLKDRPYQNMTMRNVVLMWVQREGGINDLIESLFVLYGPR